MKLDSVYTTKTAASELRDPPFDDSYIRYLCLKNDVGQHLGRDWILTQADIEILRKILGK